MKKGGGILSTTRDLAKFGNKMLEFYYQTQNNNDLKPMIKSSTIKSLLWSPQSTIPLENKRGEKNYFATDLDSTVSYGMGWFIVQRKNDSSLKYAYHTGGACGATSCLLIKPCEISSTENNGGVVVAVLCNSQDAVEISKFTLKLASVFSKSH
jgi:hypothetical protein